MRIQTLMLLITVAAVLCGGCAANPQRMATPSDTAGASPALLNGIAIDAVTGGTKIGLTSALAEVSDGGLREALRLSLQQAGYLSPTPDTAPMLLRVGIVDVEKPRGGALQVNVVTIIRYALVSRVDSTTLFDGLFTSSCTRTLADDVIGGVRLQHAEECAVQKNIATFLSQLRARQPGTTGVT